MEVYWVSVHGDMRRWPCRKVTVTVAPLPKEGNQGHWWGAHSGKERKAIEVQLPEPEGLVYLDDPNGKVYEQLQSPYSFDGVRALQVTKVDPPASTPTSSRTQPAPVTPAPVKGKVPEPKQPPVTEGGAVLPQED